MTVYRAFAAAARNGNRRSGAVRPVDVADAYEFSLPPLEEQRAIARVLGALDDRIELNRTHERDARGDGSRALLPVVVQC